MSMGGGGGSQEPSQWEIESAQSAEADFQEYKNVYAPEVDKAIQENRVRRSDMDLSRERRQSDSTIYQEGLPRLAPTGVNPNSGAFKDRMVSNAGRLGDGLAMARTGANVANEAEYLGGLTDFMRIGRDIHSKGTAGINRRAASALADDIAGMQHDAAEAEAWGNAIGSVAGAYVGSRSGGSTPNDDPFNGLSYGMTNYGSPVT